MEKNFTDFFYKQFEDKNIAFLSPYKCEFGERQAELVNGITGVPLTFKKDGADCYYFHDLNNISDAQLGQIVKQYDYFIYPVYAEFFDLLKRIRPLFKGTIIGVTDIQTHQLSYWPIPILQHFVESLRLYDYIMCTNIDEVDTFRVALNDHTKCLYTGWAMYPEQLHYPYIKENRKETNGICVSINNPGDFNRDLLTNLEAYKRIKKLFPATKGWMYYITPNKKDDLRKLIDDVGAEDFELVDELPYKEAVEYLSNAYMAIHLYTFKVVGRLAQDCAALGIPMVGTVANFPNRMCFPETSVADYDIVHAVEIAARLMTDKLFYNKVVNKAINASHFYNLENTQKRIWGFLNGQIQHTTM